MIGEKSSSYSKKKCERCGKVGLRLYWICNKCKRELNQRSKR